MRSMERSWSIALLLLGLLWVSGCQDFPPQLLPGGPDPSPTPAPVEPTALPAATAASELVLPSEPYPLRLVAYEPQPGQVVGADGVLRWTFDQAVERESFAAGLRISPPLAGDPVCQSDREVVFEVASGPGAGSADTAEDAPALTPGTRYSVAIDAAQVRSVAGLSMAHDVMYTFSALSPLHVTWASPTDGAVGLRGDVPILVEFNQEIVDAACVGREISPGGPCPVPSLVFSPGVMGAGTWVNSSLYRYEILGGLVSSSVHDVVLDAGVTSLDGAVLAEPYGWSFETAAPQVVEVSPSAGQDGVALDAEIRIVFNTPMDVPPTGGAVTVVDEDGVPVAGAMTWGDNDAELVFSPIDLLAYDTVYQVRIGERARAARSTPLAVPAPWGFRTVPYPDVVSYVPEDGDTRVDPGMAVQISFAGAIDEASLQAGVQVTSSLGVEDAFGLYEAASGVYTLVWDQRPRTSYCVTVTDDVVDDYGRALATPVGFCFESGDLPETLALALDADLLSLTADRPSALNLVARNVAEAGFVLSEVDVPAVTGANGAAGEVLREWSETFDLPANTSAPVTVTLRRLGGALPTGLYQLAWQLPGAELPAEPVSLAVVDRHVMVKLSESEALVWVADLATGAPVTRTEVQLLDADGLLIAGGTTDVDGLARLQRPDDSALDDVLAAVTGQPGAEGFGFALTTARASAVPWQFGILPNFGPQSAYRAFVQADRSVYVPGQRMQITGVVREDLGSEYRSPRADTPITLTVRGPDDAVVDQRRLNLSESGRFDVAVYLSEALPAGVYVAEVTAAQPGDVPVQPARTKVTLVSAGSPELRVNVAAESNDLVQGATARFIVRVNDRVGGSVAGATLDWAVYAEPYAFAPGGDDATGFGGPEGPDDAWIWQLFPESGRPTLVAAGTAVADGAGLAVVELPATLVSLSDDALAAPGSQRWWMEVVATDVERPTTPDRASEAVAVGSGTLVVHAADRYLGLLPKVRVVRAKERLAVDLRVVDWVGRGLEGQEVQLRLDRRTWSMSSEDGSHSYSDTMVSEQTVTTGASGVASAAFTAPRSGTYVVKAVGVDAEGRAAEVEVCLWVGGSEGGDMPVTPPTIELVADQPSYYVGDVAKILVPVPFEGPYEILLTVERDDILTVQRFTGEDPYPILELPIPATYAPNVYVSGVVVRPGDEARAPQVFVGYQNLTVTVPEQALTVEVLPGGASYAPGERAEVLVRTTDANGEPVEADVMLAAVAQRSGDVALPPSLVSAIHGARPLRVLTGDVLLTPGNPSLQSSDFVSLDCPEGGWLTAAGGASSRLAGTQATDLIAWEPNLRTDAAGEVIVPVDLPVTPAVWAVTAWAISDDAATGEGRTLLSSSMPLWVQPVAPPYLVAGDRAEIAALVHNDTGEERVIDVELTELQGLTLDRPQVLRLTVAAGEIRRVSWPVAVAASNGRVATGTIVARSGDDVATGELRDSVTGTLGLPIHQPSPLNDWAVAGELPGPASTEGASQSLVEVFDVPEGAGDATELVVRVDATLDAFLLESLVGSVQPLLQAGPDTVSAWVDELLPVVSIYGALGAGGRADFEAEAAVPAIVAALDWIYAQQNADGGWGWPAHASDLHLTSNVVLVLVRARDAGLPVRDDVLASALVALEGVLAESVAADVDAVQSAFAVRVLAEAQHPWPAGVGAALYAGRSDLGLMGRAHLATAFGLVDASDTRLVTLLDEVRSAAIVNAASTQIHWEEAAELDRATAVQVTAPVLDLLALLVGDAEEIPGTVSWLMHARRGDGWQTPSEAAWALTSLADAAAQMGGIDAGADVSDLPVAVRLNGVLLPLDGGERADASWTLRAVLSDTTSPALMPGRNVLEVSWAEDARQDPSVGPVYVATWLERALSSEEAALPESQGMTLTRTYCAVPGDGDAAGEACVPVSTVAPGDWVAVRLLVTVPEERRSVRLEDPLPAGFEIADVPPSVAQDVRLGDVTVARPDHDGFRWVTAGSGRAVFVAPALSPGTYDLVYVMEAVFSGSYTALPAVVGEATFADIAARTGVDTLTVGTDGVAR